MWIVSYSSCNLVRLIPSAYWSIVELIVLEAAHRLHFDYGIELERIDEVDVLPFILLEGSGLIHKASQRYFHIRHIKVVQS